MRLAAAGLMCALAVGCAGLPDVPPPTPDRGQILVRVVARKRDGVADPTVSCYGAPTPSADAYTRMDYGLLKDIAVLLTGEGLAAGGPAPAAQSLRAGVRFARDLALLGPGGRTTLSIANDRATAITLFCRSDRDGFEVAIPARGTREVTLREPGLYDLLCDEDEQLRAQVLVATTSWAMMAPSGGWAVFDRLPPGAYTGSVIAPRLPAWRGVVSVAAGAREIREVTVSVGNLGGRGR